MIKRHSLLVVTVVVLSAFLTSLAPGAAGAGGESRRPGTSGIEPVYRPDAWIKLCGLSTGCVINPLPHPWLGKNRYNTSGAKQKVAVKMQDGEGVRFWIAIQNDGNERDTIKIQGCKGTPRFVVNVVQIGKWKGPSWKSEKITEEFKQGTASFTLRPGRHKVITVNIIAPTTAEGVTYKCRVTLTSSADAGKKDTVIGQMTTY